MYKYYKLSKRDAPLPFIKSLPPEYYVIKILPQYLNLKNIFWRVLNIFGKHKFIEYQIINKYGKKICYAQVIGKIHKFPFIESKYDIHIGPCMTIAEERGKGFYPILLNHIISDYPESDKYMIVHTDNNASIRGIEKVGFKPFALGNRTKFGKYVIERML